MKRVLALARKVRLVPRPEESQWGKILVCGLVNFFDFVTDMYIISAAIEVWGTPGLWVAVFILAAACSSIFEIRQLKDIPKADKAAISVLCVLNLHVLFIGMLYLQER